MEEKLIEYADKIVEALEGGVDFAGEQAPIYVQEYLLYAIFHHSVIIVCMLILFAIMIFGIKACYNKYKSQGGFDDWEVGVTLFSLGSCVTLGIVVYNALQVVKISIAPRVYLIEKISSLF